MTEKLKRKIPAELISQEDVERAVSSWEEERLHRDWGPKKHEALVSVIYELFIPGMDADGRSNLRWKRRGTQENKFFQKILVEGGIWPKRKAGFLRTARAISERLVDKAIETRMSRTANRARQLLEERSIGEIPDRIGGHDPLAFEAGFENTGRKDGSRLFRSIEDPN